jgi:hypothetical protein
VDQIGEPGIEAHMENTIKVFRSVHSEALDLGVKIAIENHDGDMQTLEVRTLTEESGKDFVGSNLDTGSPEERLAFHQEHSKPVMDKRIRQRNYRVDRSGDLGYRRATAQAVGVSAASR